MGVFDGSGRNYIFLFEYIRRLFIWRVKMSKITFTMGEPQASLPGAWTIQVTIPMKRTRYNRFRFWLFFKMFPFEFKEWIDED